MNHLLFKSAGDGQGAASFCLFFAVVKAAEAAFRRWRLSPETGPLEGRGKHHFTAPESSPAPGAPLAGHDWGLQAQRDFLVRSGAPP